MSFRTKLDQATSEIKSAQSQLKDKQSRLGDMQSELENAKQAGFALQSDAQDTSAPTTLWYNLSVGMSLPVVFAGHF